MHDAGRRGGVDLKGFIYPSKFSVIPFRRSLSLPGKELTSIVIKRSGLLLQYRGGLKNNKCSPIIRGILLDMCNVLFEVLPVS